MKKLILFPLLAFALSATAQTTNVTLTWDHSASPDVISYRVWQGNSSMAYTTNWLVQYTNRAPVAGLKYNLTYFWAVTAINSVGQQSELSNEAQWGSFSKPQPPGTLMVSETPETNAPPSNCSRSMFSNTSTTSGTDLLNAQSYLATPFLSDVNYTACEVDLALTRLTADFGGSVSIGISAGYNPSGNVSFSAPLDVNNVPVGGTNWVTFPSTSSAKLGTNWVILKGNITSGTSALRWYRNASRSTLGDKSVTGIWRSNDGVNWTLVTGTRRLMFKTRTQ